MHQKLLCILYGAYCTSWNCLYPPTNISQNKPKWQRHQRDCELTAIAYLCICPCFLGPFVKTIEFERDWNCFIVTYQDSEYFYECNASELIWGLVCQKQIFRALLSNCSSEILWHVIIHACPKYLLLAHMFSYNPDCRHCHVQQAKLVWD